MQVFMIATKDELATETSTILQHELSMFTYLAYHSSYASLLARNTK